MSTVAARRLVFAHVFVLWAAIAAAGPWDAPANYYSTATGTGTTLKTQLTTIMSTGHIQRTYGDFRYSAAITDRDPNNSNNVLLVYNRASVPAAWDGGTAWNREHVWPQSLQPGDASNGTTGNLGDPHALRPANPTINSTRGNDPFGTASSTGTHGAVGSYYFPGDADKGDIARQLFYSAVRYSGLTLVNGIPSTNQMGDLNALMVWHYSDAPDEFERRRNHTIYSSAYNPSYYTNNRNAFIDRPEYAWSIFVDQANDTRLSLVGATASADGSSTRDVNLGSVFVGGAAPSQVSVGLNKNGVDGTYYQVSSTGAAFTNAGEYSRPVQMGTLAGTFSSFNVGLNASTATAGSYTGSVIVDNLDVTTDGGAGRGANDGNDTVNLAFDVVNHALASFTADVLTTSLTIDFGQVTIGSGTLAEELNIFNFAGTGAPTFAADLDIDSFALVGDGGMSLDLTPTFGIDQGDGVTFDAIFDTSNLGEFANTFTIYLSDEDLVGAQQKTLSLTLLGEVIAAPGLAGDYNGDGFVNAADYTVWRDGISPDSTPAGYGMWATHYGESMPQGTSVPEPTSVLMVLALLVGSAVRTARVA